MPVYFQSKTAIIEKLRRASGAARGNNPLERPLVTGVTVTSPAATPSDLTRGYAPFVAISSNASGITNSASVIKDVFRGVGGVPKNYGNNLALVSTTAVTGNVGGTDIQNGCAYEFMADASKVAARFFRQARGSGVLVTLARQWEAETMTCIPCRIAHT